VLRQINFLLYNKYANLFNSVALVETSYLNRGIIKCKFYSSQSDKSRAQTADFSNVCSKPKTFTSLIRKNRKNVETSAVRHAIVLW